MPGSQYLPASCGFVTRDGKDAFVARAKELAARYGDRFLPPDSLTS